MDEETKNRLLRKAKKVLELLLKNDGNQDKIDVIEEFIAELEKVY